MDKVITEGAKRVTVVGLGHSGCRTVDALSQMGNAAWLQLVAFDTDRESLDACRCPAKILAAEQWHSGQGCGGDVMRGQRATAHERRRIREMIAGSSLLIVTGGLGGGLATGGAPVFASEAANCSIPTIFLLTMPFSFEGLQKNRLADKGISELLPAADIVIPLPNDLLFSTLAADIPVEEAFKRASLKVAGTLLGIAELMRSKSLFAAELPDLKSVVGQRKGVCGVGVGRADNSAMVERCHQALERMLDSPFMGGPRMLEEADAVIFILLGGNDLQLGEMKRIMENAEKFVNPQARVVVGTRVDATYNGTVQLTAIAVKFDDTAAETVSVSSTPAVAPTQKVDKTAPDFVEVELPLQNISKGIFLNTTPVVVDGEDLDIPTHQRRAVFIDTGQ